MFDVSLFYGLVDLCAEFEDISAVIFLSLYIKVSNLLMNYYSTNSVFFHKNSQIMEFNSFHIHKSEMPALFSSYSYLVEY